MKCKNCKNETSDEFRFCPYCGEQLARRKRTAKEKAKEISVPKPRKRGDKWYIWLAKEKAPVTEDTEILCIEKAKAIRAGYVEYTKSESANQPTLRELCTKHLATLEGARSESTLRGYQQVIDLRFKSYMDMPINQIDWQKMVKDEQKTRKPSKEQIRKGITPKQLSGKTVSNAWGFVSSVLRANKISYEAPAKPKKVKRTVYWLDSEVQLGEFLKAIKDQQGELGALFALHSLRRSEVYNLTPNHIKKNTDGSYSIIVKGAIVQGRNGKTKQDTNKSEASVREVPIMIPRLIELLEQQTVSGDECYLQCNLGTLYDQINNVCKRANLPPVGVHGLRRTFATVCFSCGISEDQCASWGGWDDYKTMHECYIKLSKHANKAAAQKMTQFFASVS